MQKINALSIFVSGQPVPTLSLRPLGGEIIVCHPSEKGSGAFFRSSPVILTQKKTIKKAPDPFSQAYCISKGKEHKRYEFGAKASIVVTKNRGVIIGAVSFPENTYDGHTLPEVSKQSED